MKADDICNNAGALVSGARHEDHGEKVVTHANIAALWNAYLGPRADPPITPRDVALMMALLKIARTKSGNVNMDDYVDACGYAAIAGELA